MQSSTSTFLDIFRPPARATSVPPAPPEEMTEMARVLAAIRSGDRTVSELTRSTAIPRARLLASLAWLARAGLVHIETRDDRLYVALTAQTLVALAA